MESAPSVRVAIDDPKRGESLEGLINFASYNYLGISYRPEVIEAVCDGVRKYGAGASGSPILSGSMDLHKAFEHEIADFKGKQAALIFPSGYSANVGVIAGLMRPGDLIVADKLAHASIVDGMILSKATSRFFRHNDPDDLDRKLEGFPGKKLVIVEGVYSMDGDLADLPDILEVCRRHGARLMIDEAHSTFVYGSNGRGVAEHFGLDEGGRHPPRDLFEEPWSAWGIRRGAQGADLVPARLRPRPRLLVRASPGSGGGPAQGARDRGQRAGAARDALGQRPVHALPACREAG